MFHLLYPCAVGTLSMSGAIQSGPLWSLWELMQRFNAAKFVEISNWIAQLHQRLVSGQRVAFTVAEHESLLRHVTEIRDQFRKIELDAAEISADRLLDTLGNGWPEQRGEVSAIKFSAWDSDRIRTYSGDTVTRARDQLQARLLLEVPSRSKDLYLQPVPLFGLEVAAKFPSVAYEVEQAGKALAFGIDTGAAFHSIRCFEAGIRAMSRCLKIPDPTKASQRSWASLLRTIKTEIDRRWPTDNNKLSGDGRFFDEAYATLAAIQNPYRNATMHLDQKYTEEEARHVFEMVKGFHG